MADLLVLSYLIILSSTWCHLRSVSELHPEEPHLIASPLYLIEGANYIKKLKMRRSTKPRSRN